MNLIYQVSVGNTPAFYKNCIESVARYCEWYGIEHIVQTEALLDLPPHFEKMNAFSYLDQYDKVLVLDADVFITRLAPNIFEQDTADFAAVVERELPLTPTYRDKVRRYSEDTYRSLDDVDWCWDEDGAEFFNTGVMVLDSHIERPDMKEFERFLGNGYWNNTYDQTPLNWWVKSSGIKAKHLDWRWNVLYGAVEDISQAYFVHFFLSYAMPQKGNEIADIIGDIVEFHQKGDRLETAFNRCG